MASGIKTCDGMSAEYLASFLQLEPSPTLPKAAVCFATLSVLSHHVRHLFPRRGLEI